MKNIKQVKELEFGNDNIDLLDIIKYLLNVIINDINYMNDLVEEKEEYDLGNDYIIKREDMESLISITDTITDILDYNDKGER